MRGWTGSDQIESSIASIFGVQKKHLLDECLNPYSNCNPTTCSSADLYDDDNGDIILRVLQEYLSAYPVCTALPPVCQEVMFPHP